MNTEKALIFFTRVPLPKRTKTRLLDFLTPSQTVKLHKKLILDINEELKKLKNTQIFVFYTPEDKKEILYNLLKSEYEFYPQSGDDLAQKMLNSFKQIRSLGFKKILLIGSDIVDISAEHISRCFDLLAQNNAVITPTFDGGYCLLGLQDVNIKNMYDIFSSNYSVRNTVYYGICSKFVELGIKTCKTKALRDIDTKEDIFAYILGVKTVKHLASGEYNINYKFKKSGENFVFRINTKSQIGLKNQIKYEYDALKILEISDVTPKPIRYFPPNLFLPRGAMSMQFLPGRPLRYDSDLDIASSMLAKIHSVKIPPKHSFIIAQRPLQVMMDECEKMSSIYLNSNFKKQNVSEFLQALIKGLKWFNLDREIKDPCIINTELNSGNFLINEGKKSYIIDWEKPIIGEKEQDLAHFLAPTTTFWKTDVILDLEEMQNFLDKYECILPVDRAKFNEYLGMTFLRGLSWCAMAYVEYQGSRAIKNQTTYKKINEYLSDKFLSILHSKFLKDIL
ncbi:TIGR04282 family arsenosugar biosynthesis glycosyltransferase [Campylobacter sp. RM15925]|uniref:TIGR04282 family arsenosugar biosynthesis glycosyltransferase n=1 Tax=Campylobacter sp. RM15925 TaxID=1705724 RepID=UPI001476283E|nr:TIGR04282 family arsenosugar biosynthesis glycosyltransferase [Campylobacter sp. RM15925]